MRLRGATALITGGAGGIGRAVARRFLTAGSRVVLWDRDVPALEDAAGELKSLGPVRYAALDVTDPAAISDEGKRLGADGWEIDLLDVNAGVAYPGDLLEMDEGRLRSTVRVNLESLIWCLRTFIPPMERRGRGHVVFMASASSFVGVPGLAVYTATKHAVIGLAESLRLELRRRGKLGVKMSIICPGFVRTAMFEGVKPPMLLPWLTPAQLADRIARGIENDELYVREPWIVRWLPALRAAAPTFVLDHLGDLMGLNNTTDEWSGRR
ncbi:MAG: SDR family NAD(P)-dependent oxidoreductase [Elusimicrobia bacterium]|nr:SDR family NAD(P)-dependent oxidoreductase [Elusimicrobiota bacterium]